MIIIRPFFVLIISNFEKMLQHLPGLCKQSKNINKLCKFCIKSMKMCQQLLKSYAKLRTMHKTAGRGCCCYWFRCKGNVTTIIRPHMCPWYGSPHSHGDVEVREGFRTSPGSVCRMQGSSYSPKQLSNAHLVVLKYSHGRHIEVFLGSP